MKLDRYLLSLLPGVRFPLALAVASGLLAGIATVLQALFLSRAIGQVFLGRRQLEQVEPLLFAILGLIALRGALAWARELWAAAASARIRHQLRLRLFSRLVEAGPAYCRGERTGELANSLMEGVESLDAYFSQYLPSLALAALVPTTILIFVFPLDLVSALVLLVTAPLIPLFMVLIGKMADAMTRRQWHSLSLLSAHFLDVVQGLATLKMFNRSRAQLETIRRMSDGFGEATLSVLRVAFLSALALEMLATISTALVAVEVGLRLLYATISFEQAFFVLVLAPEFYQPLRNLGAAFHAGTSGVAAAERIHQILNAAPGGDRTEQGIGYRLGGIGDVGRGPVPRRPLDGVGQGLVPCRSVGADHGTSGTSPDATAGGPGGPGGGAEPGASLSRARALHSAGKGGAFQEIAFSDVRYSYGDERGEALRGVSFRIRRGERVALVGPSGAGKSTVAALLLRFMDPQAGALTVDGAPLADTPSEEWRQMVAWVPQDPYLFRGTVADNIRLARPGAPDEALFRAAELAGLHADILGLPRGYDTEIGERGARLSGGQAQRIALARAFLKDAPILILDEPAAHLDPKHEALVQESLDRAMEGRTTLAIAHRLGTARRADRVIVLSHGEVVEEGSHAELVAAGGLYSRMVAEGGEGEGGAHRGDAGSHPLGNVGKGHVPFRTDAADRATRRLKPAATDTDGADHGTSGTSPDATPVRTAVSPETPGGGAQGPALQSSLITHPSSPVFLRLLALVAPLWPRIALATLLGVATVGSGVGLMATASYLIASAALHPSVAELSVAVVGVRFFGISRGVFRYLERYISHQLTFRLLSRLRVWFYQALEPLAPARLVDYREGDLLNRIVADVDSLQHFYVRVLAPPLVAALATLLIGAFVAAFDPAPALVLVGFMALAGVGGPLLCRRLATGPGRAMAGSRAELASCLVEGIQGMADLVAYGRQGDRFRQVETLSARWIRDQRRMSWITGIQAGLGVWLPGAGMVAVMAVSTPLIVQGTLDGVYLAVLAMAALAGFEAVAPLPSAFQQMEVSLESGRRLFEIVDTEPAVGERPASEGGQKTVAGDAREEARGYNTSSAITHHSSLITDLRVEGLGFRYGPEQPWALRGVSLELPPGGHVALVGASGAGKSTLINLLLRFWDYQEGAVTLGGRDLRAYRPEEVRGMMAVVSQRSHLFSGTLRDNLLLARPGADEEEILRAVELSGLAPLVKSLPRGLEERIGEQGLKLSGGERQRLVIARAFLRGAPVLLLDEPTANLDNLASRRLMAGIRELARSRSVLLVTHRLAGVVEDADQILVMSGGRIVERGRHADLLSYRGLYHQMWELERLSLFPAACLQSRDGNITPG